MKGLIVIKLKVNEFLLKIKEMKKTGKIIALSLIAVTAVLTSMMISGVGISYEVIYGGKTVAVISDMSVYNDAVKYATESVTNNNARLALSAPTFKVKLSFRNNSASAESLSHYILANSDTVISGYSVRINGEHKFYVSDTDMVNEIINKHYEQYKIEGGICNYSLCCDIAYEPEFISSSVLTDRSKIETCINGMDVTTTVNKEYTYTVPFEVVTNRTNKKYTGYRAITTVGVDGVNKKNEIVTYVNGEVTSTEILSDEVVEAPVNEVVVVGTGNSNYSSVIHNASTKGYVWPLGVKGVITSYWGDGRNHKGIDIAAPAGTEIRAVLGGTVTYAGWDNDYGYNVIIDHGNGVKTRYAHSRKLHCSAGDVVAQGEFIAEVGTTGQSTGNHCHFEVIINGTRVNPAPYLGI